VIKSPEKGSLNVPLNKTKILVLYDDTSIDASIRHGHGFSCLADGRILFDTGENGESLLHNMTQMNVAPENVEAVVISHDHWDHTGGLWEILKIRPGLKVYACPGFSDEFKKRVIASQGSLIESGDFREIDGRISVTGEIPGQYKGASMPEQAIIVNTQTGIVVITGCSHPGIINIFARVKTIFPTEPIALILGGLHLRDAEVDAIEAIASQLIEMGVRKISPTHCTGKHAQAIFRRSFGANYIPASAGSQIEI